MVGSFILWAIALFLALTTGILFFGKPEDRSNLGAMVTGLLTIVFGLLAAALFHENGHGRPIALANRDFEAGRVYQLYSVVKTPRDPGWDALVGEPNTRPKWWHVSEVPSPGYIGFVQVLEVVDGKYRLAKAEELASPELPPNK